jgi:hypothetical protein
MQKLAPPEDQATAKQYVDHLRAGRYEQIEAVMDPRLRTPAMRDTLEQMAKLLPDEEPTSIELVSANTTVSPAGTARNLAFEYRFRDKWVVLNVATLRKGDELSIIGFNIYPQQKSLAEQNRFNLSGKAPLQYLILALAVVLPLLSLYALVRCIRTKMARGKWLWILFIVCGVGKLAVNWTTGEWHFAPLSIQVLSASAITEGFGQWIVAVSLPLGAILFLFRRPAAPT